MLAAARAAATAASQLLAGARPQDIRSKGNPRDLVTEWDLRAEQRIREVLEAHAPGIPVLGEEGGQGSGTGARRWLVDPIDGTVNFAHGLPIWSISIALEDAGELVCGVVAAPVLGWWFEASAGGGAFRRDGQGALVPIHVSAQTEVQHAMLASGFPYDRATRADNNFAQWEHMQRRAGACRRLGSASLDLCMVACGWYDGYWEYFLQPWDIAAGGLIVREAGGSVTDPTGGRFDPFAGAVVASNGAIHKELIDELGQVRRPAG
jgi:myo-inositol-1(or 4)-monophosphatase